METTRPVMRAVLYCAVLVGVVSVDGDGRISNFVCLPVYLSVLLAHYSACLVCLVSCNLITNPPFSPSCRPPSHAVGTDRMAWLGLAFPFQLARPADLLVIPSPPTHTSQCSGDRQTAR
ncbi:hypothetical protein B0I37DRAFT_370417 [Chaetomium sp. MPI-CAGE-AT-0009]|nr:hypothetical protein B0I37DRAFT_370417 [Chaetomium sp. MPI-CAGE-AT-0009]